MNDPIMQELADAATALSEATRSYMDHLGEQSPELSEWVSAVADHARAVQAAVTTLEVRIRVTRKQAKLE